MVLFEALLIYFLDYLVLDLFFFAVFWFFPQNKPWVESLSKVSLARQIAKGSFLFT